MPRALLIRLQQANISLVPPLFNQHWSAQHGYQNSSQFHKDHPLRRRWSTRRLFGEAAAEVAPPPAPAPAPAAPPVAAAPPAATPAPDTSSLPMVAADDPTAVSLGYSADSTKVDKTKYSQHVDGTKCGNCNLYQGAAGSASGPCPLYPGKQVSSSGWCSAYVKKIG